MIYEFMTFSILGACFAYSWLGELIAKGGQSITLQHLNGYFATVRLMSLRLKTLVGMLF